MSEDCYVVPPRSRKVIREIAKSVRDMIRWTEPCFPIVEFMEAYHQIEPEFVYDIQETAEMGDNHGITYPDEKLMLIREDIYERACASQGRDRLTFAHEFGHLFLHSGLGFAKKELVVNIPNYRNSEWQANCFGGELLISAEHVHLCKDAKETSKLFGVSLEAAEYQWRTFRREKLLKL